MQRAQTFPAIIVAIVVKRFGLAGGHRRRRGRPPPQVCRKSPVIVVVIIFEWVDLASAAAAATAAASATTSGIVVERVAGGAAARAAVAGGVVLCVDAGGGVVAATGGGRRGGILAVPRAEGTAELELVPYVQLHHYSSSLYRFGICPSFAGAPSPPLLTPCYSGPPAEFLFFGVVVRRWRVGFLLAHPMVGAPSVFFCGIVDVCLCRRNGRPSFYVGTQ